MADHVWTIICSRSIVDSDTKKVTLVDLAEKLQIYTTAEGIRKKEAAHGKRIWIPVQLTVVSQWIRSDLSVPEESRFRFLHVDPDGNELAVGEFPLNLTDKYRSRSFLQMSNFPIGAGEGVHWFMAQRPAGDDSWETVASIPLEIEFVGSDAQEIGLDQDA